ncbi:MAG TPA: bifunctional homocysteine S-methyltransferase/methylenetetrahydrofolate reductase [Bryobacteraceae bacterium]|nr:bifunctional homocysteine S-methyltransferase/methylenetetrahydrofolate reductase [Bryobacteraceae bacterium]
MPVTATQTRAAEFRETFEQRVWVADGAMGTMLYAKGAFVNRCFDELNLSLPALVRDVHQEYLRAGAEIIETNTFGANRKRLATFGFADRVRLINRAGVRIAREAARDQAFIAGAVGPLGARVEPLGSISLEEARSIFREQIDALVEAGVDCLMLETFRDLNEIRAAVEAAREIAGPDLVVVAHLSIEDDGRLQDGTSIEAFTRALDAMPVDVIGLNCSSGPRVMLETLEKMSAFTHKPLSALPNAGLPAGVDGRNIYLCSPEYMAHYAARFLEAGARIVGGCCGTTPEHIREIGNQVRRLDPPRMPAVAMDEPAAGVERMEKVPVAEKSRLGAKLAAGHFVTLVEILPPRGLDASQEIAGARLCKEAGIDGVNVPDGPRGSARLSAQITCQLIQQETGIEPVLHFSCRDRNIVGIQSELLGAQLVGIRNLICITGDPPRLGVYPDATAVLDVDSIGLANIVNNLNHGMDLGGNPLGSRTSMLLGVGVNPGAYNLEEELRRFEAKVKAGAEYAVTQPLFDVDLLVAFLARTREFAIPVITGIWPLTNLRDAEFLVHELRVPIPGAYMDRMRRAESPAAAEAEGVAIAREIVERVRPLAAGIQVSTPLGRYQTAIDVALH